ncbi:endolytic transglycosylase MltG [Actinomycetospora termitidis]|uniref:Endolytic murein transglycosylase n=1 Tax=Actinomycetospora termitidis TaxID=3053470 RepID=A0ABT7MBC5_9PSEU|nr:endolytic transglycosylase MltG [Actinomycetospora sp. Odt1-22]MDL5157970.1 endolytic transglycosylase MltG [Actinomycetospora sp. Odt1-22]
MSRDPSRPPRLVAMSASSGAEHRDGATSTEQGGSGSREVRVPRRSRGLRRPGEADDGRDATRRREPEPPTTALAARPAPDADEHDAVTDTLVREPAPGVPSRVGLPGPPPRTVRPGPGPQEARRAPRAEQSWREQPRPEARPEPTEHTRPVATGRPGADPAAPNASSGPAPRPAPRDEQGEGLDLFGGLAAAPPSDASGPDDERPARRRRLVLPVVAGVLLLALVGGAFFARDLWGIVFPPDFDGPGSGHVVVQVADGDSTRDIGESLVTDGVVASARGFGQAAEDDPRGRGIQPGYYDMARGMPAAQAVTRMLDPAARLGRLEVRGGTQLDDTAGAGNARVPGVLSLISEATCVVEESGERRCTSVDDLRRTMSTTDPAELGVPDWALDGARRALPERRLEGLVAPGTYDVRPGADAADALTSVVRGSAERLESSGLVTKAAANDVTPYQALVVASIAEREGIEADFGKIARVVYNRLPIPMRLQMDSTINYPLDRQTLLTTPVDRAAPGPYNTYLNFGLPPTPIGAVSGPALTAALGPDAGGWVYFVKCENSGASCFAVSPEEHDANRRLAQARGVY